MKNRQLLTATLLMLAIAMPLPAAQMEFEKELAAEAGWRAGKWGGAMGTAISTGIVRPTSCWTMS